jgi:glycolate oxidase
MYLKLKLKPFTARQNGVAEVPKSVINEFESIVGPEHVLSSPEDLHAYSYDANPKYGSLPDMIVQPATTEEVAAVVKVVREKGLKVVPRGSGTGLSGGTVPSEGGVVVALSRMNQLLEIDEANLTATVQAGVVTQDLHNAVEEKGLFYPPDPGSKQISTMGGNVAEGAGGLRGLKYGVTRDYVLGLEAVLADGRILRTGGKAMKDVAGYDLTGLFVGSEGTLGIITEILVELVPLPKFKRTLLALYDNLDAAARSVSAIVANRIIPATLEFLDSGTIRMVEDYSQLGLPTDAEALLLIEQDGSVPEAVNHDIEQISELCRAEGAREVKVADDSEEAAALLQARGAAIPAMARARPTLILEDATVPRSKLAEMVEAIERIAEKHDVTIYTFGHAGDGNLHPTCLTDIRDEEELERVEAAFVEIFETALQLGGTITGEHGIGLSKAPYLEWKLGPVGVDVMKALKNALDPDNIFNPGKIFAGSTRPRVVVHND